MSENRSWHTYSYALGFLCKNRCDTARALAHREGASAGGGAAGPASSMVTKVRGPVAAPSLICAGAHALVADGRRQGWICFKKAARLAALHGWGRGS
jgi:hypothetical protein